MKRIYRLVITLLSIVFILCNTAIAGGLSSRFVEVKLKDLEPGKTYSVKEMTGRSLDITNTTESVTVAIEIEPEKPVDYNLVPGYEPIPDISWVTIETGYFEEVGPSKSIETDVKISIPEGKEHEGKKYQVYIYSHTAGKATFRMGIMGRLLIDIAKDEPKFQLDKRGAE